MDRSPLKPPEAVDEEPLHLPLLDLVDQLVRKAVDQLFPECPVAYGQTGAVGLRQRNTQTGCLGSEPLFIFEETEMKSRFISRPASEEMQTQRRLATTCRARNQRDRPRRKPSFHQIVEKQQAGAHSCGGQLTGFRRLGKQ